MSWCSEMHADKGNFDTNILVATRLILLPSYYELSCLSREVGTHNFRSNEQVRVDGYTFPANGRYRRFEPGGKGRHSCR